MSNETENPFELEVVSVRLNREATMYSKEPLDTSKKVVERLAKEISDMDREMLFVINMDAKLAPINLNLVSIGTLNAALANPREMLKASILSNACGIILLHNHPSGDITPSPLDQALTKRMEKICDYVGIELLDHIIVGTDGISYYSFAEHNLLQGKEQDKKQEKLIEAAERPRMR